MDSEQRFGSALAWVVGILDGHGVSYQVVGGLAAFAYGGSRPLNDVDLYAPLAGQDALLNSLGDHMLRGPEHFTDESWDLVFMKLEFAGVRIEIGDTSSEPRYFDRLRDCWVSQNIDFGCAERITVFGVPVNVIPVDQLLAYKAALRRGVDLQDIREIRGS